MDGPFSRACCVIPLFLLDLAIRILERLLLEENSTGLFSERQRFNQWWLFLPLVLVALIPLYGILKQVVWQEDFGSKPASDGELFIVLLIPLCIIAFLRMMKLTTLIDQQTVQVKFSPFTNRQFAWSDVAEASVIQYYFVGYGIRLMTSYGTVYNIRGNQGLQLILKNGKKILIGTQKPLELSNYLAEIGVINPSSTQKKD